MQNKTVEDQNTDGQQDIWSVIRYLDPDEKKGTDGPVIASLILALVIAALWALLYFRL
jgi:hypothetical protein